MVHFDHPTDVDDRYKTNVATELWGALQVAQAIEAIKSLAQSRMVDLTEIIARG